MIIAKTEILSNEVMNKCKSKGIEAYTLKNSKANCIAFCSNDRKRREFEVTFLKDAKFRISTRFTGYEKVMINEGDRFFIDNDPDGRRKRFNVNLDSAYAVNKLLIKMLDFGFSEDHETQHI